MSDTYDVTVRIPVAFESAAEMAGFIERATVSAMDAAGWTGGCVTIFNTDQGELVMKPSGGPIDVESDFRPPHYFDAPEVVEVSP